MGGFPALMIRPPESPVQQIAGVEQVAGMRQQLQAGQLENRLREQQLTDNDALTRAMTQWDGKDPKQLPTLVINNHGSGAAALQMYNTVLNQKEKSSEIAKNDSITAQNTADTHIKNMDEVRGTLLSINGLPQEQRQVRWDAEVTQAEQKGLIEPGQFTHQYPGEQESAALANRLALGSKLQQEANERQKLALDAWKPSGGQLINPLTNERIGGIPDVAPINKALESRWQVAHPGEPLPEQFTLKAGASPTDFERIDKILEGTERSTLTKAQQEVTNAMRTQTFELAKEKTDLQAVVGIDPKSGKQVLVSLPQAQQMGIQNPLKAEGQDIQRAMAGRQWLTLAQKQAPDTAPPEEKGIMQLIDDLDKSGKLGVLASRWNDFMTRKFGEGDPEYKALGTKMGLSTTLLAQAHAGTRGAGSPFLLEHMEDLANAKKLDGPTLKAAFGAEVDYVTDRAMDPSPPDYAKMGGRAKAAGGSTAVSTGHVIAIGGKNYRYNGSGDTADLKNYTEVKP